MEKRAIKSYRDLHVWSASIEMTQIVYTQTKKFPKEEVYGLTSQMRRSAVSVASNIAEGFGRENRGSFVQFLQIAQGSLKELETQAIIAQRVGILAVYDEQILLSKCEEIGKMLRALIASVQSAKTAKKV